MREIAAREPSSAGAGAATFVSTAELAYVWPSRLRAALRERKTHKNAERLHATLDFTLCYRCEGKQSLQPACTTCAGAGGWPATEAPARCPMCQGAGRHVRLLHDDVGRLGDGPLCSGCAGLGAVQAFGSGNPSAAVRDRRYRRFWTSGPTMTQNAEYMENVKARFHEPTCASQAAQLPMAVRSRPVARGTVQHQSRPLRVSPLAIPTYVGLTDGRWQPEPSASGSGLRSYHSASTSSPRTRTRACEQGKPPSTPLVVPTTARPSSTTERVYSGPARGLSLPPSQQEHAYTPSSPPPLHSASPPSVDTPTPRLVTSPRHRPATPSSDAGSAVCNPALSVIASDDYERGDLIELNHAQLHAQLAPFDAATSPYSAALHRWLRPGPRSMAPQPVPLSALRTPAPPASASARRPVSARSTVRASQGDAVVALREQRVRPTERALSASRTRTT